MSDPAIVVSHGIGRVEAVPDTITLVLGAFSRADTAPVALRENARAVEALIAVLDAAGIGKADRRTSALQLQPEWDHRSQPPISTGYSASEQVHVVLHDVALVPGLVEAAGEALGDALRVSGLILGVSDSEPYVTTARREAVQRAMAQATELADAAGTHLGQLRSIEEADRSRGMVVPTAAAHQLAGGGGPPVEPGTVTFAVQVTARYELA